MKERDRLKRDLLRFVRKGNVDEFDALALRVATFQAVTIPAYEALVKGMGRNLEHWKDAPFVPTEVFRTMDLSRPTSEAEAIFLTSGTTGMGRQGMRRVPDLELYHEGCRSPFLQGVLDGDDRSRPWLSLIPSAEHLPNSSLSHMVSFLGRELASPLVFGADADGLKLDVIQDTLEQWTYAQEPYLMLTTSFALMHLLDAPKALPKAPAGSRLMLTGGFKGKARAVTEQELQIRLGDELGIATSEIRGEYGMTELSSQAYGTPFQSPPWLRMRVVDPVTRADVGPGNIGLVGFFDLLNLDNVSAILTSDCGRLDADGRLTLLGRAPGARTRGCSLQAEEWGVT